MARKARIEIEGWLYHAIILGHNRQRVVGYHEDYSQMLRLQEAQKRQERNNWGQACHIAFLFYSYRYNAESRFGWCHHSSPLSAPMLRTRAW